MTSFVAALAAMSAAYAQNDSWDSALFTSSPPVYPSRKSPVQWHVVALYLSSFCTTLTTQQAPTAGIGWEAALAQAQAFVANLTLDEKVQMVTGTLGPCVGNIGPIERLGFSGLCLQDGPLAIRQATYASVFSAGLTTAASWDKGLAYTRGLYMGQEFRGKGAHVALGPVVGPLGRSGYGGRNWEGMDNGISRC